MNLQTKITALKRNHNINEVFYGAGNDIYKPHILVYANDGLNSWTGYNIIVKPSGDGYLKTDKIYYKHFGLNN